MFDWVLIPVLDCWDYTEQAIADSLAQTGVNTHVLVCDNGSAEENRQKLKQLMLRSDRVHGWFHNPPLPSLSATWNRMLQFVWACGGEQALVINNDVRLASATYFILQKAIIQTGAYFVSAVGVREEQFNAATQDLTKPIDLASRGGPDFSCFLLTRAGHLKYPFDEGFIPAYGEDCSMHREYMLGGDGDKIFSVNLPYLHYASRTINQSPEHRRRIEPRLAQSRAYYARCWGGPVNEETYLIKGDPSSAVVKGATNPDLQRMVLAGETFPWILEEPVAETLGDA